MGKEFSNQAEKSKNVVDRTDMRILAALQESPKASIADIADSVGLSQTPCWRRMKRLQEQGVITPRGWVIDPLAIGLTVNVFAKVCLKQHDQETLEQLEACALAIPQVVECFSMSGDSDYLFRVIVASVAEYDKLLKTRLLHLPAVASINSNFALAAVKITIDLPLEVL